MEANGAERRVYIGLKVARWPDTQLQMNANIILCLHDCMGQLFANKLAFAQKTKKTSQFCVLVRFGLERGGDGGSTDNKILTLFCFHFTSRDLAASRPLFPASDSRPCCLISANLSPILMIPHTIHHHSLPLLSCYLLVPASSPAFHPVYEGMDS